MRGKEKTGWPRHYAEIPAEVGRIFHPVFRVILVIRYCLLIGILTYFKSVSFFCFEFDAIFSQ